MEVTEDKTAMLLTKGNVQVSKIESNNGGRSFARNVERILRVLGNTRTMVKWYHQSLNKEARIFTQAADVQNMIYYPEDWETRFPIFAKSVKSYLAQGKNKHDDAPDALTMIIEAEKKKKAGMIEVQ
jgi:predicted phage terminase large subunit-like protein